MTSSDRASPRTRDAARGYLIAVGLALGMVVSNGLARFAYALILPAMQADLGWSYTQAGGLNTINAVGYLAGSALALHTMRRAGPRRPFVLGLWITALAVLATAQFRDYPTLSLMRGVAGAASAYVLIAGSVLAARVFPDDARRAATSIAMFFGAGGGGMLLAGLFIPAILAWRGDGAWPEAWLILGGLSLAAAVGATVAARSVAEPPRQAASVVWVRRRYLPLFLAYSGFALGYFAYLTFIIALMRQNAASPGEITLVWCLLALATLASPRLWGRALAGWSGGRAMAAVMSVIGLGAGIPAIDGSLGSMLVSIVLFGSVFMAPAAVTAYVKRNLPPAAWGEAMAAFTLVFAALQCLGPMLTGVLADLLGSLSWGLGASALILLVGAATALLQRDPAPVASDPE